MIGGSLRALESLRKPLRNIGFLAALWLALVALPLALGILPLALGLSGVSAQQLPSGPGSVPKLRHGPNGEIEVVPDSGPDSGPDSAPDSSSNPPLPNQPRQTPPSQTPLPKKAAAPAKPAASPPPPAAATAPPAASPPLPATPIKETPPAKPSPLPEQPSPPGAVSTPSPAQHFVAPIAKSDLAAELIDVVKVPPSSNQAPLTAINSLIPAGDGSGRLFVNDMRGKIYVIRDGRLLETPFLDVAAARNPYFRSDELEFGLLTFAFHPDFARTGTKGFGRFYTIHTENLRGIADSGGARVLWDPSLHPDHFTVVTEWLVDPNNPDRIDPASRREVLRFGPWGKDNAGGQLAFDPNLKPADPDYGLLYIAVGDGGNSALENNGEVGVHRQAQNPGVPFGKILRVDPLENGAAHYGVPVTNPFANQPGFLPEIWAYGLRNPERFSWDRGGQHKMLIADIGQANIEEIDVGQAGANYGWSSYEGRFTVDHGDEKKLGAPPEPLPPGFVFPAAEYDHSDGYAVTGGFVYRGKALPQLIGKYIFGDIVSGDIFYADADALESGKDAKIYRLRLFYRGKEMPMRTPQQDTGPAGKGIVGDNSRADLRFGIDQDGEIYVLTKADGMIRRLASHAP